MKRVACLWGLLALGLAAGAAAVHPNPIVFVTQVPIGWDADAVLAVFDNHHADPRTAARGGDLYLLIPGTPATLVNLTNKAGFGSTGAGGFQNHNAIAVRDPSLSFDAKKVLFSMVIGAPDTLNQAGTYRWKIYELTNLDAVIANPSTATPSISLVANQPAANNLTPFYLSDGRIGFTSDYPPGGASQLYPQIDEYLGAETNSGLWTMDRTVPGGDLKHLDRSPSGDFTPILDSFGRIILTRWDHLQRDQRADADYNTPSGSPKPWGAFNWSSEAANSVPTSSITEYFPAPQSTRPDLLQPGEVYFEFNLFFPWMMYQDGSAMETINHVGRHELRIIVGPAFSNDANLVSVNCVNPMSSTCMRTNKQWVNQVLELSEMPTALGTYLAIDGPEDETQGGGQIIGLPLPVGADPDDLSVTWITHSAGKSVPPSSPPTCHTGYYRDPIGLADGAVIAAHNGLSSGLPITAAATDDGGAPNYKWRLVDIVHDTNPSCSGYFKYGANLTPGISKTVSYYDPGHLVSYSGLLWELQPVEVVARSIPPMPSDSLPAAEATAFMNAGVSPVSFQQYLLEHNQALIVSRDVTTRDANDRQQPWQLVVDQPGGAQTPAAGQTTGTVYQVKYLQIFQGDHLRSTGGTATPAPGRRVIAQPLHDGGPHPPPTDGTSPPGSVELGADGSFAALVPARRALSWQLVDDAGAAKVRERYWLGFAPGEIRVCTSCHGINTVDQAGVAPPTTTPQALVTLLTFWKSGPLFKDGFESGAANKWSNHVP